MLSEHAQQQPDDHDDAILFMQYLNVRTLTNVKNSVIGLDSWQVSFLYIYIARALTH